MIGEALRDLLDRLRGRSLQPRRFSPNRWTPVEVERRIAGAPVEWGYVFNPGGAQIGRKRGDRARLSLAEFGRDHLRNAVVVHNHPVGPGDVIAALTFSEADLRFAVEYDLAELRVVVPGWRFVLTRPAGGWPFDEQIMIDEYRRIKRVVDADLGAAVADGSMSYTAKAAAERHEGFRRMAAADLLDYQAERLE